MSLVYSGNRGAIMCEVRARLGFEFMETLPLGVGSATQLRAKDVEVGLLRASPSRLALIRSWDVDLQRLGVSFKVNGSAGITYQGARLGCQRRSMCCRD